VRVERLEPGQAPGDRLVGAVLARDLRVGEERWSKGRRLDASDLQALAARAVGPALTLLVLEPGELHEDEAALRLARAIQREVPGLELRGPNESRVDLVATTNGVVNVRVDVLERINRLDPLEVFTVFDGQVVVPGSLVASVKVGPHVVAEATVVAGERLAARGQPVVRVRPFRKRVPIAVLVGEKVDGAARQRFEASVRDKVEGLGARLVAIRYVGSDPDDVTRALADALAGPEGARIVLTAGGGSTDPADPFFVALDRLGGAVVRHGVPAHPGSMVWLGRVGRAAVVGLPSCGAYSKATAADLLLPRLVAGEPASAATVARLGYGGVLNRNQRFRFPAYARDLEAPEG
jgi:hypothetical protein